MVVIVVSDRVTGWRSRNCSSRCHGGGLNCRQQLPMTVRSVGLNRPRRGRDPAPGRVRPMPSPDGNTTRPDRRRRQGRSSSPPAPAPGTAPRAPGGCGGSTLTPGRAGWSRGHAFGRSALRAAAPAGRGRCRADMPTTLAPAGTAQALTRTRLLHKAVRRSALSTRPSRSWWSSRLGQTISMRAQPGAPGRTRYCRPGRRGAQSGQEAWPACRCWSGLHLKRPARGRSLRPPPNRCRSARPRRSARWQQCSRRSRRPPPGPGRPPRPAARR